MTLIQIAILHLEATWGHADKAIRIANHEFVIGKSFADTRFSSNISVANDAHKTKSISFVYKFLRHNNFILFLWLDYYEKKR